MATSFAVVQISATGVTPRGADIPKSLPLKFPSANFPSKAYLNTSRLTHFRPIASTPQEISDKVSKSIKEAEEACAGDAQSGECVAAWDEVEELSAAASHARDRQKESSDPLENYCQDNPETDECRTYDN